MNVRQGLDLPFDFETHGESNFVGTAVFCNRLFEAVNEFSSKCASHIFMRLLACSGVSPANL